MDFVKYSYQKMFQIKLVYLNEIQILYLTYSTLNDELFLRKSMKFGPWNKPYLWLLDCIRWKLYIVHVKINYKIRKDYSFTCGMITFTLSPNVFLTSCCSIWDSANPPTRNKNLMPFTLGLSRTSWICWKHINYDSEISMMT